MKRITLAHGIDGLLCINLPKNIFLAILGLENWYSSWSLRWFSCCWWNCFYNRSS